MRCEHVWHGLQGKEGAIDLVSYLVEDGDHLSHMGDGEDRVEHFALFLVLWTFHDSVTLNVSVVPKQNCDSLTERAQ